MKKMNMQTFKLSKITIAILKKEQTEYLKGGTDQTSRLVTLSALGSQCGNENCH